MHNVQPRLRRRIAELGGGGGGGGTVSDGTLPNVCVPRGDGTLVK